MTEEEDSAMDEVYRRTPDAELDDEDVAFAEESPALGPCCACGKEGPDVRNVMLLGKKSPLPGKGWGCLACGLPSDGASAVLCDDCLESGAEKMWACRGYPGSDGRVPIGELVGTHEHDPAGHPEMREAPG